ncbi:hypothetical protein M8312_13475 [Sphingomonas sp. KRR8]|nr:hypothetical protein [Sphingomonas sp. KRR8]URD60768.1 hypothetical protein M8312_13475 [Sphingomonas sp. KRR8]
MHSTSDGWPYFYIDELGQTLGVIDELKPLNLYPDLDDDFVLPLATR